MTYLIRWRDTIHAHAAINTTAEPLAHHTPKNGDNPTLSTIRPRNTVENKDFAAFARRIVRAFARRVGDGDIEALADLVAFRDSVDQAIDDAVLGLREWGYSWTDVAAPLGISKQAARQRWGIPSGPTIDGSTNRKTLACNESVLPFFEADGTDQ